MSAELDEKGPFGRNNQNFNRRPDSTPKISSPIDFPFPSSWNWVDVRFYTFKILLALHLLVQPIHSLPLSFGWPSAIIIIMTITTSLLILNCIYTYTVYYHSAFRVKPGKYTPPRGGPPKFATWRNIWFREQTAQLLLISLIYFLHASQEKQIHKGFKGIKQICKNCAGPTPQYAADLQHSQDLNKLGRLYLEQYFSTLLSVLAVSFIGPRMTYQHSWPKALSWFWFPYGIAATIVLGAVLHVSSLYCKGKDGCWGDRGLEALGWIRRELEHEFGRGK